MSEGPRGTPLDLHAITEYIAYRRTDYPSQRDVHLEDQAATLLAHCRALRAALLMNTCRADAYLPNCVQYATTHGDKHTPSCERAAAVLHQATDA